MIGNNDIGPEGLRFGLGLVASGKRKIKSGNNYEKYFPAGEVNGEENTLDADGTVYDTLHLMRKVVNSTLHQTVALSKILEGSSVQDTCRNVWNFLYTHIQYKPDHKKREQLREPARSWRDRKEGIDCDCFSIFSASILTNLGIYEEFKMAAYSNDFQHVYDVIPKDGKQSDTRSSYYVIDPVVDNFDYEKPPSKSHTEHMKITLLSGTGDTEEQKPLVQRLVHFADAQAIFDFGYMPTLYFLEREKIPFTANYDKQSERTFYTVNTPSGTRTVPTVMTRTEANNLLVAIKTPATVPAPSTTTPSTLPGAPTTTSPEPPVKYCLYQPKSKLWSRLILAGALVATVMVASTGSNKKTESLNGPPAARKKTKALRTTKI